MDTSGNIGIGNFSPDARVEIDTESAGEEGLHIKGTVSQTAPLFTMTDNADAIFFTSGDGLALSEVVWNEQGADIDYRIETTASANTFFIQGSNGRVGFGTNLGNFSPLNIGGSRQIGFMGGTGTIFELNSIISGGNTDNFTFTIGDMRIGGDVGGNKVNIVPKNTTQVALGIQQASGGTTTLVSLRDSSSVETMGLTTLGLTQAGAGSGVARFDVQHTVAPSSVDGDGVGLNFRTENLSGVLTDVGFFDIVFDDISANQASMRFLIGRYSC